MENTLYTVNELQDELARRTGRPVLLCLTDNRRRMVSAKRKASGLVEVRLQRIFLASPPEVITELADLLAGRKTDRTALRRFIDRNYRNESSRSARQPALPSPARQTGDHHDIVEYARLLNHTYLGGRSKALVVWGRRNKTPSRRSIRFGCYDPGRNQIVMNRKLDSSDIPAYYIQYVLFHEMLHEVLGIGERPDGRRDIHGSLFKLMESTYPDFDKALRYEKELCRRLATL